MAESQKRTFSTADTKEKGPSSFDEDFGKDFLSSWKSSKLGKDALDFDAETTPLNKKKPFNFDKLDDFELGGDFGKLSSFKLDMPKMDMPDLDFSSPLKKTQKPKEKSCQDSIQGKQETKQDKFSFTFDFNDLDRFDLDSNLLIGESKSSKCIDAEKSDHSSKNVVNKNCKTNSVGSIDVSEANGMKTLPVSESIDVTKSGHLVEPNVLHGAAHSSSSEHGHDEASREAVASTEKKIVVEENKNDIHDSEGDKQHADKTPFTKPHVEKTDQDFSIRSASGDCSEKEDSQFGTGFSSLDSLKANFPNKLGKSVVVDSSHSRNSSPVTSYRSRYWPGTRVTESETGSDISQKYQGNKNEVIAGSKIPSESTKAPKEVENSSATDYSQKTAPELICTSEQQNLSLKLLPSPLHRGFVSSIAAKETATTGIQSEPLSMTAEISQPSSALIPKQLYLVDRGKVKTAQKSHATDDRKSKDNVEETTEMEKGGTLKSQEKGLTKSVLTIAGSQKSENTGTTRLQLHPSKLAGQISASSTPKGIVSNLVLAGASIKNFKRTAEKQGVSLKDGKLCDVSGFKISGIIKPKVSTSNFTMQKETKSVELSGRNSEFPLNIAATVSTSDNSLKYSLPSRHLKRKTPEEPKVDPEALNPLKRAIKFTTERRKPLEVSPKTDWKGVPRAENPEACQVNVPRDDTIPGVVPKVRSGAHFEVPVLLENDGNVEKAEACAKELDDIRNMLKKKHDEAKELLVRAMVTNNMLLMLNHPLFDEKLRVLQNFATSLQSKQL